MTTQSDALVTLEHHVGRLFTVGVTLSAVLLAAGLALFLFAPGSPAADRCLDAGLLVLMATPMLRVLMSIVEYVRMGDWFFASTFCSLSGLSDRRHRSIGREVSVAEPRIGRREPGISSACLFALSSITHSTRPPRRKKLTNLAARWPAPNRA